MIEEAKAVAQRLRDDEQEHLPMSRSELAYCIESLVAKVERLTKVDVEPVAYMTDYGRVVRADLKVVRLLNVAGDQNSGYRNYDPYPTYTIPLVPTSALAAEQAKVRELVEVLQMMVFMVKREAPILAGKAVGHADAIIAKYGEQK